MSRFFIEYDTLLSLPLDEAVMVAFLLHDTDIPVLKFDRDTLVKFDRWMKCPCSIVTKYLNFSKPKQAKIIRRLKEKGLITVKLVGCPPVRWIKVNKLTLRRLYETANQ